MAMPQGALGQICFFPSSLALCFCLLLPAALLAVVVSPCALCIPLSCPAGALPLVPQPRQCHPRPSPRTWLLSPGRCQGCCCCCYPGAESCLGHLLSAWHSRSLSHLQLVPRGHQPDGCGDTAEAVQGGQLLGAQQRDQQERLLPLLEVSEPGRGLGGWQTHSRGDPVSWVTPCGWVPHANVCPCRWGNSETITGWSEMKSALLCGVTQTSGLVSGKSISREGL